MTTALAQTPLSASTPINHTLAQTNATYSPLCPNRRRRDINRKVAALSTAVGNLGNPRHSTHRLPLVTLPQIEFYDTTIAKSTLLTEVFQRVTTILTTIPFSKSRAIPHHNPHRSNT
ncbi:hypothetical protein Hanom_Chr06g00530641 [Helianthus anomalus]